MISPAERIQPVKGARRQDLTLPVATSDGSNFEMLGRLAPEETFVMCLAVRGTRQIIMIIT